MVPFEDPSLERAIGELSEGMSFEVTEHDVVLRGRCDRCARWATGLPVRLPPH